ncbi:hypothetical protein NIES2104_01250 [Leptolyngbya sp. NIES-2104]|nr:hypothetical protein NIES2104_01250 [Leptolyngbya sp. NIES-2104]
MQIKLPVGYKEFCQMFGNGCFGESFVCIDCPSLQYLRIQSISNSEIIEAAKSLFRLNPDYDPTVQELLGNAYVFGLGVSGTIFIFDLRTYDQTDEQYDVYAIDDDGHAYKVDRDFYSFIENFCLGTALENFQQLFRIMTYEMEYPVNRFTAIPGIQEPSD